jgi:hypothetical protein
MTDHTADRGDEMSDEDYHYCRRCRMAIRILDRHTGRSRRGECRCKVPVIGGVTRVIAPDEKPPDPGSRIRRAS